MCVDHEVRAQRIGCVFQFTRPSPVRREERRCDTALQGCGCCSAANATSPTCGGQVRSVQGALSCGELPKAHVPCCPSVPWLFVFSVRGGGRCGRLRRYTLCCVLGECVALLTSGLRLQFSRWHGLCIGHRLPASVQAGVADCCSIFPCVDAIANSSLRRQGACGAVPSSPTTGGNGRARCGATGCGAGTGACRWHRCPSCQ